jgi:putative transposase
MVDLMHSEHQVSLRQGCKAVNLPHSSYSYKRKPKNDQMIIDALLELTSKHPAIGFWQCYYRIRLIGYFGQMVPLVSEHIVPLSTSDISG